MRADRLLSIILLLQTREIVSAGELAEKLEVTERTIYRDIDALSFAGLPIYSVRGSHGGFAMEKRLPLNIPAITSQEIHALCIKQSPKLFNDLNVHVNRDLLNRLLVNFSKDDPEVGTWERRIYLDHSGWFDQLDKVPCLSMIKVAVVRHQLIQMSYRKKTGTIILREVAPYGLVAKADKWYLVAMHDQQLRVYRVSRVQKVTYIKKFFAIPRSFEITHFWNDWYQSFEKSLPKVFCVLRIDSSIIEQLSNNKYLNLKILKQDETGKVLISVTFETIDQAVHEILYYGSRVEVLKPDELRSQVAKQVRNLAALYCSSDW
ncbi:YafY family transcriptional regulator [Sporolactobacillus shoreicorticis]|uniref:Helix-turn-helix transcriptional regulator n=1 Tax=Sporolactobacillus shoreicorticis TaxID=1923877 RepID=A0ABW5S7K0_9BACL|nr:YafY family protein [Sporolactobacillus shoreicorticis]MCO7126902.1 YafY family transcriptional regulator [Sporolactobacillus shoreicorticis]